MSNSTGEKADCHGIKWFEDNYGVKKNINCPHPSRLWFLRNIIGCNITPGFDEGNTFSHLEYFLLLLPPNHLRWMTLYTSQHLVKHLEKGTTKV